MGVNLFFVTLIFSGCVPTEKLIYLQESLAIADSSSRADITRPYKLRPNDIIDVQITSMDPEVNDLFNAPQATTAQIAQMTSQNGGDLFFLTGYTINANGNIHIPFIGPIPVAGLELSQAKIAIDHYISQKFKNYFLEVRMGGIRFATIGEFNRPGKHVVMQNAVTIFEAIALSGDLTGVADRSSLKLIRQYPDSTKIHPIDVLNEDILESPYYFIQPNDVLYAEPLKQRSWGIGVTGAETFSTIIGALSTSTALMLSIISLTRD